MKKSIFILLAFVLVLSSAALAASPYFFKGIAHVNGSLAPNGTIIGAFIPVNASKPVSSVTIGEGQLYGLGPGKYVISFEAESGNVVAFKINGINLFPENGTNTANQTLGTALVIDYFNLSINKSANTLACAFSNACTGGFCVHSLCRGASTFCGDGFCDSGESCSSDDSACSSGQACTNGCVATSSSTSTGGGGGGGGGGGPSLPSTTETVNTVSANTPTSVTITETKLPVSAIEITTTVAATNVQVTVKEVSQPSGASVAISTDVGRVYKYLDITASGVTNAQLSKTVIKFKVPKTWLTANGINADKVYLNKLVGTTWTKLSTAKTGETLTDVLYEAETPGFSAYAITGEKVSAKPAECGNNIIESGEECDEQQLAGQSCETKGFPYGGTLKCTNCRFDTSECYVTPGPPGPDCGNNVCEAGEENTCPRDCPKPPLPPLPEGVWPKILIGLGLFAVIALLYYLWVHRKGKGFAHAPHHHPAEHSQILFKPCL